jgi:eukaryotic-like serine/threonine-protein kinase
MRRRLAALSHTNIVTMHAINEHEDQAFIVMDYVQGQALKNKIAKGCLPIDEAVTTAIQIAEGLKKDRNSRSPSFRLY